MSWKEIQNLAYLHKLGSNNVHIKYFHKNFPIDIMFFHVFKENYGSCPRTSIIVRNLKTHFIRLNFVSLVSRYR